MDEVNHNTGISDIRDKRILVLGCGNILFGDDGFGPRVAEELLKHDHLPEDVGVIIAGTSVRTILFDTILSDKKPERIIIIDAVDAGKTAGEIFELSIDGIPEKKIDDFSMHQLPTSNLLKELKDLCEVDVIIIACQVENIPTEVCGNLSNKLMDAIPEVSKRVYELVKENRK